MKKIYEKPNTQEIKLNAPTLLLQASATPPNAPGFNGWMG
jgi:hypothetical protein